MLIDHPFVISIVSVMLGTGILGYFNYARARRDAIRDASLSFLNEVGAAINPAFSSLYTHVRLGRRELDADLWEASSALYQMRLSVRIRSASYLGDDDFAAAFDEITHQIRYVMECLQADPNNIDPDRLQSAVLARVEFLCVQWRQPYVESVEGLEAPNHALVTWLDTLWNRAERLLGTATRNTLAMPAIPDILGPMMDRLMPLPSQAVRSGAVGPVDSRDARWLRAPAILDEARAEQPPRADSR